MKRNLNPDTVHAPLGAYSHAVLTSGQGRCLQISGQVGIRADGSVGTTFEEQAEVAWENILSLLHAAEMDVRDLTKIVTYITDAVHYPSLGPIRRRFLGDERPASTLLIVKALILPQWLIEIEVTAFRS